jgi:hypothetical protein
MHASTLPVFYSSIPEGVTRRGLDGALPCHAVASGTAARTASRPMVNLACNELVASPKL